MTPPPLGAGVLSRFSPRRVAVRVPATSANVGPGFDSFGLALSRYDAVEAAVAPAGLDVDVVGEGAGELPRDESSLVVRALRAALDELGVPQPGLRVSCRNDVPQGRGLGSSAAAIVAGIRLAEALVDGQRTVEDDLSLATRLDGHPDNVAACLLGSFTVAWTDSGSRAGAGQLATSGRAATPAALRLDVHPDVQPVVFVAPTPLSTRTARRLLPNSVAHADAKFNAGRAGLLVAAMTTYPELLLAATEDRLHQEARRGAMPETLDLVDRLRDSGIAAVVSGSGPSVLAFTTSRTPVDEELETPAGWRALRLSVDTDGASEIPASAHRLQDSSRP